MSLVVCGISASVNSAYQSKTKGIGVSIQSVYNKLNGLEPPIVEALVRHGVSKAKPLIDELNGRLPALLPSYQVKILDGNHLAGLGAKGSNTYYCQLSVMHPSPLDCLG